MSSRPPLVCLMARAVVSSTDPSTMLVSMFPLARARSVQLKRASFGGKRGVIMQRWRWIQMSVRRRCIPTGVSRRFLVLGTCARSLRSGVAGCSTQTRIGSTAVVGILNLRMRGAVEGNVEGNVEDVWEVANDFGLRPLGALRLVLCPTQVLCYM